MIEGVDLKRACDLANKSFGKIAESRITEYVKGLKIQSHNLKMKSVRLQTESDQAIASMNSINERLVRIENGDWGAVEQFEMSDKQESK